MLAFSPSSIKLNRRQSLCEILFQLFGQLKVWGWGTDQLQQLQVKKGVQYKNIFMLTIFWLVKDTFSMTHFRFRLAMMEERGSGSKHAGSCAGQENGFLFWTKPRKGSRFKKLLYNSPQRNMIYVHNEMKGKLLIRVDAVMLWNINHYNTTVNKKEQF